MSGREVDWDDEDLGALAEPKKKGKKKADVDLDLEGLGLLDDEELVGVDSGGAVHAKKKKPTKAEKKKTKKKTKKKAKKKKDEALDDDDLGLGDEGEQDGEVTCEGCADDGKSCDRSCEMTKAEATAGKLGIDLSMECPVCRSLEPCECEEEDRSFVRRTRFEEDVKKVARCPRCQAPLSVVYLPRPGLTEPPFRLAQFEAIHACSCCRTEALATLVLSVKR